MSDKIQYWIWVEQDYDGSFFICLEPVAPGDIEPETSRKIMLPEADQFAYENEANAWTEPTSTATGDLFETFKTREEAEVGMEAFITKWSTP
jgi:hypothetical protein